MENYNARYARHYSLKDFGMQGQRKLLEAKVLVIGAGGLGCPVLQYLTACGIGTIGIADHDIIALDNLQRQILFHTEDIGQSKAAVARQKLSMLNPEIKIISYEFEITTSNALELIAAYDIIVDCTDNFTSRYLINDACVLSGKPMVSGSIFQYEGQVAVFNVQVDGRSVNYRDLFPNPPAHDQVSDCNGNGVLGVLPGIVGMMQASEVIKSVAGIGGLLAGKLLTFDLISYETIVMEITAEISTPALIPADKEAFKNTDYPRLCGASDARIEELDAQDFLNKAHNGQSLVIDVRERCEVPKAHFPNLNIPLSELDENLSKFEDADILLFCQSGRRSLRAGEILLERFGNTKKISHLRGGIIALKEEQ